MTQKTAHRRYIKVFIPAMVIYMISIFAISWANIQSYLPKYSLYFLTIIPVLSIFAWMWAQWRYVKELDEYMRARQVEAMMYGMMVVVAFASGWGLMELMTDVPRIPIFFAGPGFYLFYGIIFAVMSKRAGEKGACL